MDDSNGLRNQVLVIEAAKYCAKALGAILALTLSQDKDWWRLVLDLENRYHEKSHNSKFPTNISSYKEKVNALDFERCLKLLRTYWPRLKDKVSADIYNSANVCYPFFCEVKHENNQTGLDKETAISYVYAMLSMAKKLDDAEAVERINEIIRILLIQTETGIESRSSSPKRVFSAPIKSTEYSFEKLKELVDKVGQGHVTTYGWLSMVFYKATNRGSPIASGIKRLTKLGTLCHRIVSDNGTISVTGTYADTSKTQKDLLISEGVPFVGNRVDLDKCMVLPELD